MNNESVKKLCYKINIVNGVECGGFHWTIEYGPEVSRELLIQNFYGCCQADLCKLKIDTNWPEDRVSEVIIHEFLEAINNIYLNKELDHSKLERIGFGLHQIMESLGVRFEIGLKDQ